MKNLAEGSVDRLPNQHIHISGAGVKLGPIPAFSRLGLVYMTVRP